MHILSTPAWQVRKDCWVTDSPEIAVLLLGAAADYLANLNRPGFVG
jgi:hypothetical protein